VIKPITGKVPLNSAPENKLRKNVAFRETIRARAFTPMTAKQLSEQNRRCRIKGYERIRQEKGLPEPSEHDRTLRRLRNERYRAKKRGQQADQSQAASKTKEATPFAKK
jgi:hypothetical protein